MMLPPCIQGFFAAMRDGSVCTNLQVQVHQVVLVELVDALQRLSDQTGDLSLRQQLVRHAVVKYLPTCRAGQRRHTETHSQGPVQPEADSDRPPMRCPGGAEPRAASMKGSLRVQVHTEIHDGLTDFCWFQHKCFARGDLDQLTGQKPHTSFLNLSPGRASA